MSESIADVYPGGTLSRRHHRDLASKLKLGGIATWVIPQAVSLPSDLDGSTNRVDERSDVIAITELLQAVVNRLDREWYAGRDEQQASGFF
ncbi:hypothetical protein [Actinocrispum wychmicini]|uniref:hypothetical protein n=1 Tax=Actinocrispum wychmicini TaxID=1213861 RepID=UPI00104379D2|nr:hypothetical protein [Actinocrispum wychmicini]